MEKKWHIVFVELDFFVVLGQKSVTNVMSAVISMILLVDFLKLIIV